MLFWVIDCFVCVANKCLKLCPNISTLASSSLFWQSWMFYILEEKLPSSFLAKICAEYEKLPSYARNGYYCTRHIFLWLLLCCVGLLAASLVNFPLIREESPGNIRGKFCSCWCHCGASGSPLVDDSLCSMVHLMFWELTWLIHFDNEIMYVLAKPSVDFGFSGQNKTKDFIINPKEKAYLH